MLTNDSRQMGSTIAFVAGCLTGRPGGRRLRRQDRPERRPGRGWRRRAAGVIGGGGNMVKPGDVTVPPGPIDPVIAFSATRKVKNLLIGQPPTDDDVALVTQSGAAGLQQLISTWLTTDPYRTSFGDKMVGLFRNVFQQTGFTPTEDFKPQLLTNGGFDFGPIGTRAVGDDAFPRLVQNLQDSFAMTAWQLVREGRPFTEVLTTNRFVMTTALKSLYIQTEMTADAPFGNSNATPAWTVDFSGAPIPLEQALTMMTFSDESPANGATGVRRRPPKVHRRGRGVRFVPRHVAAVPAPARLHAALPVHGRPDLLRAPVEAVLHDQRPD